MIGPSIPAEFAAKRSKGDDKLDSVGSPDQASGNAVHKSDGLPESGLPIGPILPVGTAIVGSHDKNESPHPESDSLFTSTHEGPKPSISQQEKMSSDLLRQHKRDIDDGDSSSEAEDEFGPKIPDQQSDKAAEEAAARQRLTDARMNKKLKIEKDNFSDSHAIGNEGRDKWMIEPPNKGDVLNSNPLAALKKRGFVSSKVSQKTSYESKFDPSWTKTPYQKDRS